MVDLLWVGPNQMITVGPIQVITLSPVTETHLQHRETLITDARCCRALNPPPRFPYKAWSVSEIQVPVRCRHED